MQVGASSTQAANAAVSAAEAAFDLVADTEAAHQERSQVGNHATEALGRINPVTVNPCRPTFDAVADAEAARGKHWQVGMLVDPLQALDARPWQCKCHVGGHTGRTRDAHMWETGFYRNLHRNDK